MKRILIRIIATIIGVAIMLLALRFVLVYTLGFFRDSLIVFTGIVVIIVTLIVLIVTYALTSNKRTKVEER